MQYVKLEANRCAPLNDWHAALCALDTLLDLMLDGEDVDAVADWPALWERTHEALVAAGDDASVNAAARCTVRADLTLDTWVEGMCGATGALASRNDVAMRNVARLFMHALLPAAAAAVGGGTPPMSFEHARDLLTHAAVVDDVVLFAWAYARAPATMFNTPLVRYLMVCACLSFGGTAVVRYAADTLPPAAPRPRAGTCEGLTIGLVHEDWVLVNGTGCAPHHVIAGLIKREPADADAVRRAVDALHDVLITSMTYLHTVVLKHHNDAWVREHVACTMVVSATHSDVQQQCYCSLTSSGCFTALPALYGFALAHGRLAAARVLCDATVRYASDDYGDNVRATLRSLPPITYLHSVDTFAQMTHRRGDSIDYADVIWLLCNTNAGTLASYLAAVPTATFHWDAFDVWPMLEAVTPERAAEAEPAVAHALTSPRFLHYLRLRGYAQLKQAHILKRILARESARVMVPLAAHTAYEVAVRELHIDPNTMIGVRAIARTPTHPPRARRGLVSVGRTGA